MNNDKPESLSDSESLQRCQIEPLAILIAGVFLGKLGEGISKVSSSKKILAQFRICDNLRIREYCSHSCKLQLELVGYVFEKIIYLESR